MNYLIFYVIIFRRIITENDESNQIRPITSEVVYGISFDGVLYSIDIDMRKIKWSRKNGDLISTTRDESGPDFTRFLIPNPTDGSLYSIIDQDSEPRLNKIARGIPELVAISPLTSHNGILQLGHKTDIFEEICTKTGEPLIKISPDFLPPLDFAHENQASLPISKTRYNLALYTRENLKNIINITFDQYNFYDNDFDYRYIFLTSSQGYFAVLDSLTSLIILKFSLGSPMIHIFKNFDKKLFKLSLFHIADEVMHTLFVGSIFNLDGSLSNLDSLFLTKFNDYSYVMPGILIQMPVSFVKVSKSVKLPDVNSYNFGTGVVAMEGTVSSEKPLKEIDLPSYVMFSEYLKAVKAKNDKFVNNDSGNISSEHARFILPREIKIGPFLFSFTLVVVTFLSVFFFSFYKRKDYEYQKLLQVTKDIGEGKFQIRKIKFDSNKLLGQGSDGTCIFGGTFEDRPVAVKRILSASCAIANQEVMALCESDQHPNVIRYFSTEYDHQFYYIALELCQFTLYEFIKNDIDKCGLDNLSVLRQTTSGLFHLHSLRIVHRDLKPHNILISLPNTLGVARVLISDFGLCKKIPLDRSALTNRASNLVGTSGWMAPEIIEESSHPLTFSSDIFSLGCIFYFVLSNGFHPFGESLNRQFNIQSKEFNLNKISKDFNKFEVIDLIKPMISHDPNERSNCEQVLGHLFFWGNLKRIQFLQDFSNYIEDISNLHPHIVRLEQNSLEIVRGSWSFHIPRRILEDLTYHRDYSPSSVRDLLRAIRNKASHLKESPKDIKEFFKDNPNNLIKFFSDIFPRFLLHLYRTAIDLEYSDLDVFRHYFKDIT